MTYSILALEEETLVIGVVSGSVAVGKRVPWAIPKVGGVVTQGYTNPALGPRTLEFLRRGCSAQEALKRALDTDPAPELRQLAVLSWRLDRAYHCGSRLPKEVGVAYCEYAIAIGNLLSSAEIPDAMIKELERRRNLPLHLRILKALERGHLLGGDARGDRTASMVIAFGDTGRILKIDVDLSSEPLRELHRRIRLLIGN